MSRAVKPAYGIDLYRVDGTRDGYYLPRASREGAIREARNLATMSGVRTAVATVEEGARVRVLARFESSATERVSAGRIA